MNISSANTNSCFLPVDSWYSTDHNQRYRLRSGITWKRQSLFVWPLLQTLPYAEPQTTLS